MHLCVGLLLVWVIILSVFTFTRSNDSTTYEISDICDNWHWHSVDDGQIVRGEYFTGEAQNCDWVLILERELIQKHFQD